MSTTSVYLDTFIRRESLLYRHAAESSKHPPDEPKTLYIRDFIPSEDNDPLTDMLRKPDFQRATWSWTPEDCAELLRATLSEQVVPGIIMWLSPDDYYYVLDGAHRISVILAWISDNWGDRYSSDVYKDEAVADLCRLAGKEVRRELLRLQISPFREYQAAYREERNIEKQGKDPSVTLKPDTLAKAQIYRKINGRIIGFPIQWVKGDHRVAEQSFLNINKRGSRLSEWETKLVEHRNSSFARSVMAIANVTTAEHCWTETLPDGTTDLVIKGQIAHLLQTSRIIHDKLFQPEYEPKERLLLPIMHIPAWQPDQKPYQIAEFLTIVSGYTGQAVHTERLMKQDRDADGVTIINNGVQLSDRAIAALAHITGKTPLSLALIPALYFYNPMGSYVRSLFYGFLYWILENPNETLDRKRLFSAHRSAFEQAFLFKKEQIIKRINRRIGSGTEVTYQTAAYFSNLLKLILEHKDHVTNEAFLNDHQELIETLKLPPKSTSIQTGDVPSSRRGFTPNQQRAVRLNDALRTTNQCPVCGGALDIFASAQYDHIVPFAHGGPTSISNAQLTHPFCNNNREHVTKLRQNMNTLHISWLSMKPTSSISGHQISLFDDPAYLTTPYSSAIMNNDDTDEDDVD